MHLLIIFTAKYLFLVPISVLIWLLIILPKHQKINLIIITIVGAIACAALAKLGTNIITDPRPFIKDGITPLFKSSTDNGFPSDHALLSFFISFVIMRFRYRLGIIMLVLSAIIGWARVYSGVHHFTDVLGALVIAAIAFGIGVGIQKLLEPRLKK